ncbi:MAG TPA: valine--tRNA ligase [Acidimicrobiia bacterium]|nr:valine--tRNA ligase [Acidimicrobiia bacterium]
MKATYDPGSVEADWYDVWETAGVFRPEHNPDGAPFCLVIPPPNVTGSLHMGHALNHTIHDVIVRRKRMQGAAVLWLPGTDHAGIATQNVVERSLADRGTDRHQMGRAAFIEAVWQWREQYGDRISLQMRRLGDSVDWTRQRFTLDEGLSKAVREVFVRLYEEGLIYRGDRIINWCPRCGTAIAEIEVEYEDDVGELVYITYPFVDGAGGVTVATTRAETMLGDTAVAVHPDDERYRDIVGRFVLLPLVERAIPIVADQAVDPEFGTGAVKVTPAHDPNDFEIAERHGLPAVKIFDERAIVTRGEYAGMDRFEAREAVKHALRKRGYLDRIDEHHHSVGHCYRCGTVVEPYLSLQWFVSVRALTLPAIQAVREGRTRFVPQRWEKNYFHWMENLRDWCISRQIWWGHRIPAWYCDDCRQATVAREDPSSCSRCGGSSLRQDEDVLDTWFSSALWPFSTLGWPDRTEDLQRFYPNAVLITGFDIIYFWVARMMQMGLHFMEDVPFADMVIHGLVRDASGRKMSKSIGNAIDPLDVIDEHGADPLRLALIQAAAPGHDVPFDPEWVVGARKFGNKVWNAVRFALQHLPAGSVPADGGYPTDPGPIDRWVLHRLAAVTRRFDELCDAYRFSDAYGLLYNFAWSEVFDWYLEMAKAPLRNPAVASATRATLGTVLRDLLKLFHPAIPFLTEELWSVFVGGGLLAGSRWPDPPETEAVVGVESLQELVTGIRRFKAEHGLAPRVPLTVTVLDPEGLVEPWWTEQLEALAATRPHFAEVPPSGIGFSRIMAGSLEGYVELEGLIDAGAERARLDKTLQAAWSDLAQARGKLANRLFLEKAPAEVVAGQKARAAELSALVDKLATRLTELGG